jgi:MoxR-like ATPase
VSSEVEAYVVALVAATRTHAQLQLGASPRATVALYRAAQAAAFLDGRDFVRPDDVKAIAEPVLAHRLVLAPEARSAGHTGAAVVHEALEHTPVPV